jgi:hypothetical protein
MRAINSKRPTIAFLLQASLCAPQPDYLRYTLCLEDYTTVIQYRFRDMKKGMKDLMSFNMMEQARSQECFLMPTMSLHDLGDLPDVANCDLPFEMPNCGFNSHGTAIKYFLNPRHFASAITH